MAARTDMSRFDLLPVELLEAIVYHLPPNDAVAFGATCKRCNKVTYEPLVWRRHCLQGWTFWQPRHDIADKLARPPARTKWRQLYQERSETDKHALTTFDHLLLAQQYRMQRMEEIAQLKYDVKDLLLRLRDETSEDAQDVLARRYYANAILGQIHRATAIERWVRLQTHQMVALEEVLGAYDLFVLSGRTGDLADISQEFDRIAHQIQARDPNFGELSIRQKSVQIARYLRAERLVGNPSEEDYHALRNNFMSIALFQEPHTSLPLQSVAIYCAVARRLGVNAKPSNYPHHVHAIIEAPQDVTLDGKVREGQDEEPESMHMDPWRSSEEVPRSHLTTRLSQMGAPTAQHAHHLGPASMLETAIRAGRNIMTSVHEARESRHSFDIPDSPDVELAWYSMLWSMVVLGESSAATTQHRRRQCLPYLMEHYQKLFPEDMGLIERIVIPLFINERENQALLEYINKARWTDGNKKAPSPRIPGTKRVAYKVGQHFRHKRYGYGGFVIGWDQRCDAGDNWIQQMHVDDLPGGRDQPFYHVVANDKTVRYVAEENINVVQERPPNTLMGLAGRYFKRWDDREGVFVSNIKDEYPDD